MKIKNMPNRAAALIAVFSLLVSGMYLFRATFASADEKDPTWLNSPPNLSWTTYTQYNSTYASFANFTSPEDVRNRGIEVRQVTIDPPLAKEHPNWLKFQANIGKFDTSTGEVVPHNHRAPFKAVYVSKGMKFVHEVRYSATIGNDTVWSHQVPVDAPTKWTPEHDKANMVGPEVKNDSNRWYQNFFHIKDQDESSFPQNYRSDYPGKKSLAEYLYDHSYAGRFGDDRLGSGFKTDDNLFANQNGSPKSTLPRDINEFISITPDSNGRSLKDNQILLVDFYVERDMKSDVSPDKALFVGAHYNSWDNNQIGVASTYMRTGENPPTDNPQYLDVMMDNASAEPNVEWKIGVSSPRIRISQDIGKIEKGITGHYAMHTSETFSGSESPVQSLKLRVPRKDDPSLYDEYQNNQDFTIGEKTYTVHFGNLIYSAKTRTTNTTVSFEEQSKPINEDLEKPDEKAIVSSLDSPTEDDLAAIKTKFEAANRGFTITAVRKTGSGQVAVVYQKQGALRPGFKRYDVTDVAKLAEPAQDAKSADVTLTPQKKASGDNAKAAEGSSVTVDAKVKKADGQPVSAEHNVTVVVKTANGTEQVIPAKTTAEGKIVKRDDSQPVTFVAGNLGETSTVKVYDGDAHSGDNTLGTSTITAGKDPAKVGKPVTGSGKSTVSVPTGSKVADGKQPHTVTVKLVDAYGDPVTGAAGELSLSTTSSGYTKDSNITFGDFSETDTPGTYTANVKSTKVGTPAVSATYKANTAGETVQLGNANTQFVPGELDNNQSVFTVSSQAGQPITSQKPATAGDIVKLSYTPKDAQGNVVDLSGPITVTVPGTADPVNLTKGEDGNWTGTAKVKKAGDNQFTTMIKKTSESKAVAGKSATVPVKAGPVALQAASDAPQGTKVTTIAAPASAVEKNSSTTIVMEPVTDAYGNPVDATKVTAKIGETPLTVAVKDGKVTVTVPTDTAGEKSVQLYYDNQKLGQPISVTVNEATTSPVAEAVPASSTVVLTPQTKASGDDAKAAEGKPVTVSGVVTDKDSQPVLNRDVTVVVKTGDGVEQVIRAKTIADGKVVKRDDSQPITFMAGRLGEVSTVKVYDGDSTSGTELGSNSITAGKDPAKVGVPVFSGDNPSVSSISSGSKVADGKQAHMVTVKLVDAYGVPVKGKSGELGFTADQDSVGTFGAFTESTETPGTYTSNVTSKRAGTVKLQTTYGKADPKVSVGNKLTGTFTEAPSKPAKPTNVVANATKVTGKVADSVPAGSAITVKDSDGNVIGTGKVKQEDDGSKTFEVTYAQGKVPVHGAELKVTVTDKDTRLESDPADNVVVDAEKPSQPTIVLDKAKKSQVTGKTDPGTKVKVCVTPANSEDATCVDATVNEEGEYTANLDSPLNDNDTVKVLATDPAGNDSDPATQVVDFSGQPGGSDTTAPAAPTDVVATSEKVTGKVADSVPAGSTVTVLDESGHKIGTGTVVEEPAADGVSQPTKEFTVIYDEGMEPAVGAKVKVTVTDKDSKKTSSATEATVTKPNTDGESDTTAPAAPTDVRVSDDGKAVTGKGEPGTTATVKLPDGSSAIGKVDEKGNFKVDLPDGKTVKPGESVSVTLNDDSANTSEPVKAKRIAEKKPVNPVFLINKDGAKNAGLLAVTGANGAGLAGFAILTVLFGVAVIAARRRQMR